MADWRGPVVAFAEAFESQNIQNAVTLCIVYESLWYAGNVPNAGIISPLFLLGNGWLGICIALAKGERFSPGHAGSWHLQFSFPCVVLPMPSVYTTLYKSERQSENSRVATLNQNKLPRTHEVCSTNLTCSSRRVTIVALDCPAQKVQAKKGMWIYEGGPGFRRVRLFREWKCRGVQHRWSRQVLIWKIRSTIPGCGGNTLLGSAMGTSGHVKGKEQ